MSDIKRFFLVYVLPFLIAPLYWLYARTWRFREHGPAEVIEKFVRGGAPCVLAHWHGDELALIGYYTHHKLSAFSHLSMDGAAMANTRRRIAVLSSLSKDGAIMANTLRLLGFCVFRGSSSRGGARGLIGLIRAGKSGMQTTLAVDGPQGPIYEVKPGIVALARKTGNPIIPLYALSDRSWYIPRAWNKSYLPKFFALIDIHYGSAIYVQPTDSLEAICKLVKDGLR